MLYLLLAQTMVIGAVSFICMYAQGEVAALSVILGGLVYSAPHLVTHWYLSRSNAVTAAKVMTQAYVGLAIKLAVSMALFVFIFKYIQIQVVTFFIGYVVAFVVQCIMSFGFIKRN